MAFFKRTRQKLSSMLSPEPPEDTPEHDLWMARKLLAENDLKHGAAHLGWYAVSKQDDPQLPDLIADYFEAAKGRLGDLVLPEEGKLFEPSQAALTAWSLMASGKLNEALSLLVDLTEATSENDCLASWAPLWIEDESHAREVSEGTACDIMSAVGMRLPERHHQSAADARRVEEWGKLAELLKPQLAATGNGLMAFASTMRRCGKLDEALTLLDEAVASTPSWHAWCARGIALKNLGRKKEAAVSFDHAAACDPDHPAGWLEAGDAWSDLGEWRTALQRYETLLQSQPEHEWAQPSAYWCRWMGESDTAALESLLEASESGNSRASDLSQRCGWGVTIPRAEEASLNFILNQPQEIRGIRQLACSCMEAPSGHAVVHLWAREEVPIDTPEPEPGFGDPRKCVEQVRWPLWSYRDRKSAPALPAPSGAWQSHLDSLLAVPWRPEKVWQASGMAALHCAGENELTDLLAHAVHLSVPPHLEETDWSEITQYLRRLQHTVAWIAAQVQKESSWQSSLRREALRSLILGPQDWTTCAGITAACQLAITDAACAAELHQMLGSLWDQRPQGRWEWEDVLLDLWPAVPGVRTQTLERIQKAAAEKAAFE